jgi:hypothetical protein
MRGGPGRIRNGSDAECVAAPATKRRTHSDHALMDGKRHSPQTGADDHRDSSGPRCSSSQLATWGLRRSCTCSRRANCSTTRATFDKRKPAIPAGRRHRSPTRGARSRSHSDWDGMSRGSSGACSSVQGLPLLPQRGPLLNRCCVNRPELPGAVEALGHRVWSVGPGLLGTSRVISGGRLSPSPNNSTRSSRSSRLNFCLYVSSHLSRWLVRSRYMERPYDIPPELR